MATSLPAQLISEDEIVEKIYIVRGQKIMLDKDLAVGTTKAQRT